METFPLMVDWRSALTTCGAQCVAGFGVIQRQQWSAGSWAMTPTVSVIIQMNVTILECERYNNVIETAHYNYYYTCMHINI